jgi:hypothetical protein
MPGGTQSAASWFHTGNWAACVALLPCLDNCYPVKTQSVKPWGYGGKAPISIQKKDARGFFHSSLSVSFCRLFHVALNWFVSSRVDY